MITPAAEELASEFERVFHERDYSMIPIGIMPAGIIRNIKSIVYVNTATITNNVVSG